MGAPLKGLPQTFPKSISLYQKWLLKFDNAKFEARVMGSFNFSKDA